MKEGFGPYFKTGFFVEHLDSKQHEQLQLREMQSYDDDLYKGQWLIIKDNVQRNIAKPHGRGMKIQEDGSIFEGNFQYGSMNGRGRLFEATYELCILGEFDDDVERSGSDFMVIFVD